MEEPSLTIKLSDLNKHIICPICHGYLIDATTLAECLHTFCKSCIVKHIKNDHNQCPKCNTIIHERRPLDYLIPDRNYQDVVYKLVPQLYISVLNDSLTTCGKTNSDIDTLTQLILKEKFLHIALVPRRKNSTSVSPTQTKNQASKTIYLKCPFTIRICHIRKLLIVKFQLGTNDNVTLLHKGDIVSDMDQVSNLAQSLTFCLHYEISRQQSAHTYKTP